MLEKCRQKNVDYVFGLGRNQIGRLLNKSAPVSCVGVFDYQGAQVCTCFIFAVFHNFNVFTRQNFANVVIDLSREKILMQDYSNPDGDVTTTTEAELIS